MMLPENVQKVLETADATIEKTLKDYNLPGLGVGIVYQGQLIYAKGAGQADVARNVPVTPDTVFRIASVSKTFAAVGLMQLICTIPSTIIYATSRYSIETQMRRPSPFIIC